MKIEKINDKQIRCTLNRADLDKRDLLLSELAYGSQKAKKLFSDLMQKASNELGFETEDTPLMIEAIPVSTDCLVLIVTKVENEPDELDTRFSRFSSGDLDDYLLNYDNLEEEEEEYDEDSYGFDSYFPDSDLFEKNPDLWNFMNSIDNEIRSTNLNDFKSLKETLSDQPFIQSLNKQFKGEKEEKCLFHVVSFTNFNVMANAVASIGKNYSGNSKLYKNPVTSTYYLVIYRGLLDSNYYHHCIHVLCEYGKLENTSFGTLAYYNEHFKPILSKNAINTLCGLA